jgi:hypothetical protein
MNQSPFRNYVLGRIQEAGRRFGAPDLVFPERAISVQGQDIWVGKPFLYFITRTTGFFLTLPANAFGMVIYPDGTSHNMEGGVHEVPPGLYKLHYVDKRERLTHLSPTSEMSTDGEKITLTVVLRYRVIDPVTALRIDRPVETLVEHVEADVAQYIRTHDHTDLADSSENQQDSKLLAFFVQRHNRRFPLSKAFIITGIELKDFSGDHEYVEMRRQASIDLKKTRIEKEQTVSQQELIQLKAQYQAEAEKSMAEHNAELKKKAAEHKLVIEQMEATHKREIDQILEQVRLREIDLGNKRMQLQRLENIFSQITEPLARLSASGMQVSPAAIETMINLMKVFIKEMDTEASMPLMPRRDVQDHEHYSAHPASTSSSEKVETLKNTLLSLLNPKK